MPAGFRWHLAAETGRPARQSGANHGCLVLDELLPNLFEYALGLKDHKEFDSLMRQYCQGAWG